MLPSKYPFKPLPGLELPRDYLHRPLFLNVDGEEEPVATDKEDSLFFNVEQKRRQVQDAPRTRGSNSADFSARTRSTTPSKTLRSRANRSSILREKTTLIKQLKDLDQEIEQEELREVEESIPAPSEKARRQKETKVLPHEVFESKPTKAARLLKQRNEERAKEFEAKRQKEQENEPYVKPRTSASEVWKREVQAAETNRANKLLRAYIKEREAERQLEEEKEQRARDLILRPQGRRKRLSKESRGMNRASSSHASTTETGDQPAAQQPVVRERPSASSASQIISPPRDVEEIETDVLVLDENDTTPKRSTGGGLRESQIIMSPEPLPSSPIVHRDPWKPEAHQKIASISSSSRKSGSSSVDFCIEHPTDRPSNNWENAASCSSEPMSSPREGAKRFAAAAATITTTTTATATIATNETRQLEQRVSDTRTVLSTATTVSASHEEPPSKSHLQLLSPVKAAADDEKEDVSGSPAKHVLLLSPSDLVINSPAERTSPRADLVLEEAAETPRSARTRSGSRVSFTTIDSVSSQDIQQQQASSSKCSPFTVVSETSPLPSAMKGTNTNGGGSSTTSPTRVQVVTPVNDGGAEQKRRLSMLRQSHKNNSGSNSPVRVSPLSASTLTPSLQVSPPPRGALVPVLPIAEDASEERKAVFHDWQRPLSTPSPVKPRLSFTERKVSPKTERPSTPSAATTTTTTVALAPRTVTPSRDPNVSLSMPKLSRDVVATSPPSSRSNSMVSNRPKRRGSPHGPAEPLVSPSASTHVERSVHLIKEPQLKEEVPELQESYTSRPSNAEPGYKVSGSTPPALPRPPSPSVDCSEIKQESVISSPYEKKPRIKTTESQQEEPTLQNDSRSPPAKDRVLSEGWQHESAPSARKADRDLANGQAPPPPKPESQTSFPPAARYTISHTKAKVPTLSNDDDGTLSSLEYWRRKLERTRLDITYELAMEGVVTSADLTDGAAGILSTILRSDDEHASMKAADYLPSVLPLEEGNGLVASEEKSVHVDRMAEQTVDSDGDSVEYEQGRQEHAPTPLQVSIISHASVQQQPPEQQQQQQQQEDDKLSELDSSTYNPDNAAVKLELPLVSSSSGYTGRETPHSNTHRTSDEIATPPRLAGTQREQPEPAAVVSKRLPPRKVQNKSPVNPQPARSDDSPTKDLESSPPPKPVPLSEPVGSVSPPRPATPVPFPAGQVASPPSEPMLFTMTSQSPDADELNRQVSVDEGASAEGAEGAEVKAAFRGDLSSDDGEARLHFVQFVHRDM